MKSPTITVATCTKYTVRLPNHMGWAVITLDNEIGLCGIHSDYGNWSYHWNARGDRTIHQFLIGCDRHYLMEKFGGAKNHFNAEKTVANIRRMLIEARREHDVDTETARDMWDRLDAIADECMGNSGVFYERVTQWSTSFDDYLDLTECGEYDHDPGLVNFMDRLWPVFIEHLKGEVSQ